MWEIPPPVRSFDSLTEMILSQNNLLQRDDGLLYFFIFGPIFIAIFFKTLGILMSCVSRLISFVTKKCFPNKKTESKTSSTTSVENKDGIIPTFEKKQITHVKRKEPIEDKDILSKKTENTEIDSFLAVKDSFVDASDKRLTSDYIFHLTAQLQPFYEEDCIGLQCRYCALGGSSSKNPFIIYPTKLRHLKSYVQGRFEDHFSKCEYVPELKREMMQRLSSRRTQEYTSIPRSDADKFYENVWNNFESLATKQNMSIKSPSFKVRRHRSMSPKPKVARVTKSPSLKGNTSLRHNFTSPKRSRAEQTSSGSGEIDPFQYRKQSSLIPSSPYMTTRKYSKSPAKVKLSLPVKKEVSEKKKISDTRKSSMSPTKVKLSLPVKKKVSEKKKISDTRKSSSSPTKAKLSLSVKKEASEKKKILDYGAVTPPSLMSKIKKEHASNNNLRLTKRSLNPTLSIVTKSEKTYKQEIVLFKDEKLIPSFTFALLQQFCYVQGPTDHGGIRCKHCTKFTKYPSSERRLRNCINSSLHTHFKECSKISIQLKEHLTTLRNEMTKDYARIPKSSVEEFHRIMWKRLSFPDNSARSISTEDSAPPALPTTPLSTLATKRRYTRVIPADSSDIPNVVTIETPSLDSEGQRKKRKIATNSVESESVTTRKRGRPASKLKVSKRFLGKRAKN